MGIKLLTSFDGGDPSRVLELGKDILYNNMNFPDRAAACAVCLGLHAARGDYGGCE